MTSLVRRRPRTSAIVTVVALVLAIASMALSLYGPLATVGWFAGLLLLVIALTAAVVAATRR